MKKTSFFKLFLVGAFALTLGFVGCNNGPSKAEYEQLCKDLDALEETVGTMKTKLDAINGYVVAIEHEEGSNTFTVVYSNNTRQPILIPPGGGDDDPLGRTYVNEEGFWVVEDEETEYRPLTAEDLAAFLTAEDLAAMMGQIPTPRVSDDGKAHSYSFLS